ncbi:tRNA-specific adenosine deaminase [Cordyceps fumosorosea ARSEF 2679]|uniref:tRNA-specific adenosine deaminase n=1 Tax=Cordyceps fumosorosea (strain ARSEF 2679) TaxID=1081104 RepID=A0A162LL60_CORFA|nr:tRNA-specific adenosine deaminase [Cordyceps fumosorosea ARSEF 2679]OAA72214.1 tRNA-specific adenosine deaminase [Cordyceps fumosorosea ARSEF 2679]
MAASTADVVAEAVLAQFDKLPAKRKPKVRENGLHEWVPISGIVVEKDGNFTCVSLATGMKCLPTNKIPECNGVGLHDWHAEILAIRTFNRYILDECARLVDGDSSDLIERTISSSANARPFRLRGDVQLHMYASEAPCGDASMENLMAAQEDASPWDVPSPADADCGTSQQLPGRAYFSQLGVVRRKPARSDAPPTLSKSCSDKLALKQCTSLLSSLTSLLVDAGNAYITTLVLPEDQHSAVACQRAFSATGRMRGVVAGEGEHRFRAFTVTTTAVQFAYSRRVVGSRSDRLVASNLAAAWCPSAVEESILGGVIQGRKPFLLIGASRMSRRSMWRSCRELADRLADWPGVAEQLAANTYGEVKQGALLAARNRAKARAREVALPGWIRGTDDDSFKLE